MYNNIKLEKGLYSITGKTFTQALAELDPDANYENTELKGLDAFERQQTLFLVILFSRSTCFSSIISRASIPSRASIGV